MVQNCYGMCDHFVFIGKERVNPDGRCSNVILLTFNRYLPTGLFRIYMTVFDNISPILFHTVLVTSFCSFSSEIQLCSCLPRCQTSPVNELHQNVLSSSGNVRQQYSSLLIPYYAGLIGVKFYEAALKDRLCNSLIVNCCLAELGPTKKGPTSN